MMDVLVWCESSARCHRVNVLDAASDGIVHLCFGLY